MGTLKNMSTLELINKEINTELSNESVSKALLATTFKGLTPLLMKQAIMEGMMRGFTFKDFLEKNVYAIPFKDKKTGVLGYSLITSIDYARKLGFRNGIVGVAAPVYEMQDKEILSCSITLKRKIGEYIGEYTATVFFSEYNTGYQQWAAKPRTMIAKVAEMHALRKACPEELSQMYAEEEMQKETISLPATEISDEIRKKVENAKTEKELKDIWDEHKGLGKEFSQMVVAQKKFLKEVAQDEKA